MDKRYIEENEFEIKYLRNQLNPDELEEFEVYLMENPEMVEQLQLVDCLESSLSEESQIIDKAPDVVPFVSARVKSISKSRHFMRLAATFLMGAGVMNLYSGFAPEQGNTQIAYLSELRGGGNQEAITTISLSDTGFGVFSRQKFVIIARTDDQSNSPFQGVVTSMVGQKRITLGTVIPDQYGDVVLALNVRRFPVGKYRLELMRGSEVMFEQVFQTEIE